MPAAEPENEGQRQQQGSSQPSAPTLTRTRFDGQSKPALDVSWGAVSLRPGQTVTGYEVRHRKKGATEWVHLASAKSSDGTVVPALSASTTSFRLSNLEAGAVYQAQVRSLWISCSRPGHCGDGKSQWSETGEGTANQPPKTTTTFIIENTFARDVLAGGNTQFTKWFEDEDKDALTWSTSSNYPGIIEVWVQGAGDKAELQLKVLNPASATITYGASDPYGGYVQRTALINGVENVTRKVLENSEAGIAVGQARDGNPVRG